MPSGSGSGRSLREAHDRAVGVGSRGIAGPRVSGVAIRRIALECPVHDRQRWRCVRRGAAAHLEHVSAELSARVERVLDERGGRCRGVEQRAGAARCHARARKLEAGAGETPPRARLVRRCGGGDVPGELVVVVHEVEVARSGIRTIHDHELERVERRRLVVVAGDIDPVHEERIVPIDLRQTARGRVAVRNLRCGGVARVHIRPERRKDVAAGCGKGCRWVVAVVRRTERAVAIHVDVDLGVRRAIPVHRERQVHDKCTRVIATRNDVRVIARRRHDSVGASCQGLVRGIRECRHEQPQHQQKPEQHGTCAHAHAQVTPSLTRLHVGRSVFVSRSPESTHCAIVRRSTLLR